MNSPELNLSGTQLINTPLNTVFPEENSTRLMSFSSSSNTAPILRDTTVSLTSVAEDSPAPSGGVGTPISSIVGLTRNVTDTDAMIGIAITEVGTGTNGTWFFTTDGGRQWAPLTDVSETSARLLVADFNNRIYFQPVADYTGFISNAITFRAWDRSDGTISGGTADVTSNGGATAFSVDTDTASLTVFPVNDPPINIIPNTTTTNRLEFDEDTEFKFQDTNAVKVRDIDAGDGTIEVTLSANNGILFLADSINPNPSSTLSLTGTTSNINTALEKLVYKPFKDYNGIADIRLITIDRGNTGGSIGRDEDIIYLNVLPVNDAPTFTRGFNDTVDEDFGLRAIGWATNISKGASNELNQTVSFTVVTSPEDSQLFDIAPSIDTNGFLRYQPKANASGTARVSVILKDNGGTDKGGKDSSEEVTFSITVNPVNDPPVNIIPSLTQTVKEESVLTFSNARRNSITISDSDAGAGIVQVKLEAPNGILSISTTTELDIRNNNTGRVLLTGAIDKINAALEGLQFTPNKDFNGTTFITITTNDQNNSGRGPAYEVSNRIDIDVLPINDRPRFTKGNNQVIKEDTPPQNILWATDISPGATNENNQFLRFIVTNDNNSLFLDQPTISPNGILSYSLAPNQSGVANVTVVLQDSGDNSDGGIGSALPETFTITVTPVNDAPTNKVPNSQVILEDSQFVFSGDNAISINDIDAGNNPVQVKVTTTNGILTWDDSKVLSTAQGQGTNTVILTGTINSINTDLNGLTFKPNTNFNGLAIIQVITNDQGSTGDGRAWETSSNIAIQVNPVNDAPEFSKGSDITVNEDAGLVQIPGWATRVNSGAADEVQFLDFVVRNTNNTLFAEQPRVVVNGSLGTLIFRTAENANGSAKVFVRLRDFGGTLNNGVDTSLEQEFTINVGAVNDAPENRIPNSQSMDEDGTLVFSTRNSINNAITVRDIDVESATLETTISTQDGTLSLSNTDNLSSSTITPTSITLVGTTSAINAALDGLTFRPTTNFNGTARIQVTTNDQGNTGGGALTDTDIITVTVNPINDAPTFTPGADITVLEDGERYNQIWATDLSTGPLDDTKQNLRFIVTNSNNALFSEQPTIAKDGTLTFKSAANANGEATVTVQLQDDGGVLKNGKDTSDPITFKISVTAVADAPVNNIPTRIPTILEDGLALAIFSVNTGNPITITEVDGEPNATVQITLTSENGTIMLGNPTAVGASGDFSSNISFSGALTDINQALNGLTFKPNKDFNGEAEIKIVSSKQGQERTDTIKVNVISVNDAPTVIPGENLSVSAGASQIFRNWAKFSPGADNESAQQVLQYIVTSVSDARLFTAIPFIDSQGNLTFTTARDIKTPTTATIRVRVRDNGGTTNGGVDTSEEKTFTITVNPIQVNITAASEFVEEGSFNNTDYNFNVTLTGASNETVTVKYSTVDDSATVADNDYQQNLGTLTFAPGETTKTVRVVVKGDTKFETDQTFQVNLLEVKNTELGTASAVGTIKNDDTRPVISIGNNSSREGSLTLKLPVGLSNASDEEVSIEYDITDGTAISGEDYTPGANPSIIVFAPGETSKTLTVKINDDNNLEANETLFVELKNPTNGTISTTTQKATGTIVNDEAKNTTDIDGDGYSDIVLRNNRTGENVVWFMNNFTVDKGVFIDRQGTNWVLEGVADFTNEGKVDLLYRNHKTGENEIWMMDGAKRLKVLPLLTMSDTNWKIKGVQDFNGDRKTDIMWDNSKTGESMIWLMNGPIITKGVSLPKVEANTLTVELVADLSGDGKTDILWHNQNTGASTVWVMNDTTVDKVVTLEAKADTNINIEGVGDFNNDAILDIVVTNYITGENTVWFLDNAANNITIAAKEKLPSSDTKMRIEQIADFDNDGNLDFLYRNYSSGENEIWRMKGTSRDQIIKLTKLNEEFWELSV